MRFGDFLDPERGPEKVVRLALYPLILAIVLQLITSFVRALPAAAGLGLFLILIVMSPLAYLIRERRRGSTRREGARRGAERTPLLPTNEEDQ
jgi:hypothetical protein